MKQPGYLKRSIKEEKVGSSHTVEKSSAARPATEHRANRCFLKTGVRGKDKNKREKPQDQERNETPHGDEDDGRRLKQGASRGHNAQRGMERVEWSTDAEARRCVRRSQKNWNGRRETEKRQGHFFS